MSMEGTSINDWITPYVRGLLESDKTYHVLVDDSEAAPPVESESLPWYKDSRRIKAAVDSAAAKGLFSGDVSATTPNSHVLPVDDSLLYLAGGFVVVLLLIAALK